MIHIDRWKYNKESKSFSWLDKNPNYPELDYCIQGEGVPNKSVKFNDIIKARTKKEAEQKAKELYLNISNLRIIKVER